MKKLLLLSFFLTSSILFGTINSMEFNGTSTTVSGVQFTFSTGSFVNSIDGSEMDIYDNHPYSHPINGGGDYKDITISHSIYITTVNVTWAVNIEGFKLQFLNNETVVKELSSLTLGDKSVNAYANKIRFLDYEISSSGGFELASVKWDDAMPVELISFTANIIDDNVKLGWQTATEINNYGFEIEKQYMESKSKNTEWITIGFVEGNGNSNSPKNYSFLDDLTNITAPVVYYRLKQLDNDGNYEYSNEIQININPPGQFVLKQNYPNPFNPTTVINYSIPKEGVVTLKVYNLLGQEVATLLNKQQAAGSYKAKFNASQFSSGVYFYRLNSGKFNLTKKAMLLK